MADIVLTTIPASFASGYCPSSSQQLANDIANGQRVLFPSEFSTGILSPNAPSVEERSKIWFRLDSSTNVINGVFTWAAGLGLWLQDHWRGYGVPNDERRIFVGAAADVDYYDAGEPGTVSSATGPFWKIATAFADHWPLGVGTTIAAVGTDVTVFDPGAPGSPKAIGCYFLQPTGRIYDRG